MYTLKIIDYDSAMAKPGDPISNLLEQYDWQKPIPRVGDLVYINYKNWRVQEIVHNIFENMIIVWVAADINK